MRHASAVEWAIALAVISCAQLRDLQVQMAETELRWIAVMESPRCRQMELVDPICKAHSSLLIQLRQDADAVDREVWRRCRPDAGR